jgi:hypothetical protein
MQPLNFGETTARGFNIAGLQEVFFSRISKCLPRARVEDWCGHEVPLGILDAVQA